jgi:general secretion pathway protein E
MQQGVHEAPLTLDWVLKGLLKDNLLSQPQARAVAAHARSEQARADSPRRHPLEFVADQHFPVPDEPAAELDLERLARWLADTVGLPYLRIDPLRVEVSRITHVMKRSYAARFNILPVTVDGSRVTVATAEPWIREWEQELGATLRLQFKRVIANPVSIERFRKEFYAIEGSILGAHGQHTADSVRGGDMEQRMELADVEEVDPNHRHVVRIVDWLLQYAFEQGASDIHLEPRREQGNVRFRIDGLLHQVNELPTRVLGAAVSRLKAMGRMDVVERRRPQDGRLKTRTPSGREVELRLSSMPTTFGEKLVMRIFDPEVLVRSLQELGFDDHEQEVWQRMVSEPHGMIIVTGPTGSGKTTTLYSALRRLARPELNICTIEDPIELVDPALNQMYVQPQIGLDFATGVRALLRQDPDIIMVGEIRDSETADTAVQAALTGHLVLSTLHTNDAPSSIVRLMDLGVAPYLMKSSLIGIAAQRLVRTLCPRCCRPARLRRERWQALTLDDSLPPDGTRDAVGCDECRHTGYKGRSGIFELLRVDSSVREAISSSCEAGVLRSLAVAAGMRSLRDSGIRKVAAGITTPEEVLSVLQGARSQS